MRIVLLTTDTPHHTYYAWKIHEVFAWQAIFIETKSLKPPFNTAHPFEEQRDEYEKHELLKDFSGSMEQLTATYKVENINDKVCIEKIASLKPQIILVFGTGKISPAIIKLPSLSCLNLHGGDPERYRGLDTHLWAIYHRDFNQLITTLHHVDEELDSGDIVFKANLPINQGLQLHQLRAINTKCCVQLTLLALTGLEKYGWLPSLKQTQIGRYYSFMPAELKEICLKRFQKYTQTLSY